MLLKRYIFKVTKFKDNVNGVKKMRVLIVEDEKTINDIITKTLKKENYSVDSCFDGEEALDYIFSAEYDALILDIMLPKIDGFEILKKIRSKGISAPVLFLTARESVEDRVKGLDLGADDYLIKPFDFDELLARIRAMLRKNSIKSDSMGNIFKIANLTVDCNTHIVSRDNKKIRLSPKEFSILEYLIRNKNRVISKNQIEEHIYDFDSERNSNVIEVHIRLLRRKIDTDFTPKLIHTVRGVGYVLREEYE